MTEGRFQKGQVDDVAVALRQREVAREHCNIIDPTPSSAPHYRLAATTVGLCLRQSFAKSRENAGF